MDENPSSGKGDTSTESEILQADPVMRRTAISIVLITTVLGAAAIEWLLPWAAATIDQAVQSGMPRSVVCQSTLAVLSVFALTVAAFGLHTARLGKRVSIARQFPLPGTRVIRDTRVVRGRAAVLVGHGQAFLGKALIVLSTALLALTSYGLAKLSH